MSAPENASREASLCWQATVLISLRFSYGAGHSAGHSETRFVSMLGLVPSAEGSLTDIYLRKLAGEVTVPQSREEARMVLDGEEVDDNERLMVGPTASRWSGLLALISNSLFH